MAGHIARAPAKGRLTARPICWKRPLVFRCAVIAAYAFSAGCSYVAAMAISIRTRGHELSCGIFILAVLQPCCVELPGVVGNRWNQRGSELQHAQYEQTRLISAKSLILWCGRRDSNPHGKSPKGF